MYNFIFAYFYKFYEWRKGFQSISISSLMVALSIVIHLGFIHSIVRYSTGFNIGKMSESHVLNKLAMFLFLFSLVYILYSFYYKRNATNVLLQYKDLKISSLPKITLVLIIMLVPLVLGAILTNLAVKKFS